MLKQFYLYTEDYIDYINKKEKIITMLFIYYIIAIYK